MIRRCDDNVMDDGQYDMTWKLRSVSGSRGKDIPCSFRVRQGRVLTCPAVTYGERAMASYVVFQPSFLFCLGDASTVASTPFVADRHQAVV